MSVDRIKQALTDVELAYTNWLKKLNIINNNKRYSEKAKRYSASSAGLCPAKHYFKYQDTPQMPPNESDFAKMRLGTIVHEDIQTALEMMYKDDNVTCELPISFGNVKGHLDVVIDISDESKECILIDIKTMAAFPWSKKYGHNKDPNPAPWNKMQLATYANGLKHQYGYKNVYMYLLNYNKNTSVMRFEEVEEHWIDEALKYWKNVDEYVAWYSKRLKNEGKHASHQPMYKWECKYCPYEYICKEKGED